jgi:hypothetical protein
MQGFRYCVAGADLVILSVHHTSTGAAGFIKRNGNLPNLQIWNNGRPYAVAVGDIVPASAVLREPPTITPRRWKHGRKPG